MIMIIMVQLLGFISPLIVKSILDDYILGIEYSWVEVNVSDDKTVAYNEKYYKQERYLDDGDVVVNHNSIILYKNGVYFADGTVEKGQKVIDNGLLTVTAENNVQYTYNVTRLSVSEVTSFYRPMFGMLYLLIILLFAKTVLTIAGTWVQHLSTNRLVSWMARDGRTKAMKNIERMPIADFESEPSGKTAARIIYDVDGLIALYRLSINIFITALLSFIFAYVGMFYLDTRLALLSFVIYPLAYIWVRFFLKKLKIIAEKVNETRSLLTAKINEIINGISILQIFNFRKQTITEFNEINATFKNEQLKDVKLNITLGWNMLNIAKALVTTAVVAYFGWQYLNVSDIVITAGLIYAYNEYLLKIIEPISIILTQISPYQHAHPQIDRIYKIIDAEVEDDTKYPVDRYKGDIAFDNVWFKYTANDYVLKGVSFDIKAGQMIGLVGHTGSGKSSLMNLLLRFYDINDPLSGNIYIDGKNIQDISKRSYREHIGIVLQDPVLFKGTIASNIRLDRVNVPDEEVERVLISVGGEKIIKKFEKGINHPITRAGVNLSSGEKQIIALARVIIHDPSILIMDESTSHIDTETEELIKHALKVVCKNRTVIVIAHRLSTIFNADKIIVLDHGLKVEEGTHTQLVAKNGVYANIYRAQVANVRKKEEPVQEPVKVAA
jgi:ATP-binding cassette subfamily B protein